MKFKNILIITCSFLSPLTEDNDLEEYRKLEIKNNPSIKKSDLPSEFSDKAFEVVDEFIKKTGDLNYEILIFFDYITGEILKCKIGSKDMVKLKLKDNEFSGHHVASIHNHTKDMYSPPSYKNFGIFLRTFEDYELIAGIDGLWILKGKTKDEILALELKTDSLILFKIALRHASSIGKNQNEIDGKCDELYGILLSKFINDKNLTYIQLEKKEYYYDKTKH